MTLSIEITIQEGAGLLWLASADLGGLSPAEFASQFDKQPSHFIRDGHLFAVGLNEDSGFHVRITDAALSESEQEEWVAQARAWLRVGAGGVYLGSVLAPDYFGEDLARFEKLNRSQKCELGALLAVEPGDYAVEIYNYLPSNLCGAADRFLAREDFYGLSNSEEAEDPLAWFLDTRPQTSVPRWVKGEGDYGYLDFLVRLSPHKGKMPELLFGEDNLPEWQYRKPQRCPLGLLLSG